MYIWVYGCINNHTYSIHTLYVHISIYAVYKYMCIYNTHYTSHISQGWFLSPPPPLPRHPAVSSPSLATPAPEQLRPAPHALRPDTGTGRVQGAQWGNRGRMHDYTNVYIYIYTSHNILYIYIYTIILCNMCIYIYTHRDTYMYTQRYIYVYGNHMTYVIYIYVDATTFVTSISISTMMGTLEIGVCNRPADGHLNTLNK